MNILIAPNSMKGSLDAFAFADAVEEGFKKAGTSFHFKKIPVADGGDYTGEVLKRALGADTVFAEVKNPLGQKIRAEYAVSGETAIIEMASASGMKLLKREELNPLKTTSFGTGQLILDALKRGCNEIILGIGGSATVDGGMGLMEALGAVFTGKNGNRVAGNGAGLEQLLKIEFDPEPLKKVAIKIVCDVDNPLLGSNGAALVFGPQKGATPEMAGLLEAGLKNWAEVLKKSTGADVAGFPGAGAAGGLATGLVAFFGAEMVDGANFILDLLNFDEAVLWAGLVITGEGRIDAQTLNRKAPYAVAQRALKFGKPVIAIAGSAEEGAAGLFGNVYSIKEENMPTPYAMANARQLVAELSRKIAVQYLKTEVIVLEEIENKLNRGHISEAEEGLEKYQGPRDDKFWMLKGRIVSKQQKWGEAINCFQKVIALNPGNEEAKIQVAMIETILNYRNPELYNP